MEIRSGIVLIGSGNAATQLALALHEAGQTIRQVYSPNLSHAQHLAEKIGASVPDGSTQIVSDAALYLIAVKDEAIAEVAAQLQVKGIVAHTSGSIPLSVLQQASPHTGIFYPLQTLQRDTALDFASVPLLIEASDTPTREYLEALARRLSRTVAYTDSQTRSRIHLAAVLACNFTNHLYTLAEQQLKQVDMPLSLLWPLIRQTVAGLEKQSPARLQTGPASRGDKEVMNKHLEMLNADPQLQDLYRLLSESIRLHPPE